MRSYLAGFRALLTGSLAPLHEADRTWRAAGYYGWEIENLIAPMVQLGDTEAAIELLRESVRRGHLFIIWKTSLEIASLTLPPSETLQQLNAEHEALKSRLRKRFVEDTLGLSGGRGR
ncbi:MAG: hypothetical protein E2P02_09040 [Acidobacteria bacterium]|nr:MAG: hypothetical protein E2P02_09040 [Acidobacteriota bacterium]